MSTGSLHTIGPIVTPSGQINQIERHSVSPGIETFLNCSDGQVDYSFAAVMFKKPVLSFSTSAIALALSYAGINGLSITTALDFWFQKAQAGGTRMTGANSTRFTATNGILAPRKIEVDTDGHAVIEYEMAAISADGSTSPLTVALNQTMPSILATRQFFTVGPASFNGTSITGVNKTSIDFGMEIVVKQSDGETYPTFTFIQRRKPTIKLRTSLISVASTIGFFANQSATDSVFYLRKLAAGGTRVANGTAEHISFTVDDGMMSCQEVGADDGKSAEAEIVIEPIFDGTNDVIAVNTATAIS